MPKFTIEGVKNKLKSDKQFVDSQLSLELKEKDTKTEKLSAEYESPAAGVLHIIQAAGATVAVGEAIAELLAQGEAPQATDSPASAKDSAEVAATDEAPSGDTSAPVAGVTDSASVRATPAAKKMARIEEVDLTLKEFI